MSDDIAARIDGLFGRLVGIRHELHAHPELAFAEHETARRIVDWLGQIEGLRIRAGLAGGTGIVAVLDSGKPGPTVALRADIDALPVTEETHLPWSSTQQGVMHACGHDGHATCLLGAAFVLAGLGDQLAGQVKFIFQPAEETYGGAREMVKDGALAEPDVDVIFGLHGWPGRKVGRVATRSGSMMASTDNFHVTLHGAGAHGACPHLGVDPVVAAAHVVVAIQSIVARRVDPLKSAVITVGRIHGGSAVNIIPAHVELGGTIRSHDPQVRQLLRRSLEQVVRQTAIAHGCQAEIRMPGGYPAAVNDPRVVDLVARTANEVLGEGAFRPDEPPSMAGEDFAFYLERVPGCLFFIGTCPADADHHPLLHTPQYDFTDEAIRTGVRMFCELTLRCARGALDA